jgi:hypothetical protein
VAIAWGWIGLCPSPAQVELTVANPHDAALKDTPVTGGIPFPKGKLQDVSGLGVSMDGKALPAQFRETVSWEDGSVRWVLMDTQVSAEPGKSVSLALSPSGKNAQPDSPVRVSDKDQGV